MKYCSECAKPVELRWDRQDGRERHVCTSCGTIHYRNPRIVVACALFWRDKLLLSRRANEPARGKWIVPSGYLECGETLQQGAAREALEETGVMVDPAALELYSVMDMPAIEEVYVTFRAELHRMPAMRPGPECMDVALLSEDELPLAELAWLESLGDATHRFFGQVRSGKFAIYLASLEAGRGNRLKSREYALE
jgi:ADP-ribose pyrophosphatase YjhB (NUDIX family)